MESSNGVNQKNLIAVLLVIIIILSCAVAYFLAAKKAEAPENVAQNSKACTQEAKICPDGTSVSRMGTNCEFAPCPGQNVPQTNLPAQTAPMGQNGLIYANTDYGFKLTLPEGFEKYKIMVEKEPFEKGKSYVSVMLPTTYPNWVTENRETHEKILGYENIFGVAVWDRALWDKEINSKECKETPYPACPFESEVLGKTAEYVFEINLGNGDPTPDLEQIEVKVRANNAKIVKDGFGIIK